jgi:molybdopterin synthase catalytic subunit
MAAAAASSSCCLCAADESWWVEVTPAPLDLVAITGRVTVPAAGAVSSFIGTTRNNFDGRPVVRLEYEAYVPMALAKLKVACVDGWSLCAELVSSA